MYFIDMLFVVADYGHAFLVGDILTDIYSKEKRSDIMSKIRGKDTKFEVRVRSYLFKEGYRFRKNDKRYPGSPDIVLPKYKIAIFINGCFWHGHKNCKHFKYPKTNVDFWKKKIRTTTERDLINISLLEEMGFRVITLWECELKRDFDKEMNILIRTIKNRNLKT